MRARRLFLPMLVAGLLSCAGTAERDTNALPLPDGLGRVCVSGAEPRVFMQSQTFDGTIIKPEPDGELTCTPIAPGRTWLVVGSAALFEVWVDAGETTTLELGDAPVITASAAHTQTLARIFQHGRCVYAQASCSAEQVADALAQLEPVRASSSVRERQLARLLAWSLIEEDDHETRQRLAGAIWAEREAAPLVAASFPESLVQIATVLGDEARRELERSVSEASDQAWSALSRQRVLLALMHTAGAGAEADALRARVRALASADLQLREGPLHTQLIEIAGFDPRVIAMGETIARNVVAPYAGEPCQPGSRWLLYVHSPACPACKPAVMQLTALLDKDDAQLRVVTVSVEGDPPPLAERPDVEATSLPDSLAAWFDEARGGVVTPYFFGLTCDAAASLSLVGFGSLPDATNWEARATSGD